MTTDRQNRPWWHPEVYAQDSTARAARIAVRSAVRRFFEQRGYTEVETPILQLCPGMEPHLGVFRTILEDPDRGSLPRLLHTSPEFTMKKLLVAGESRIFQIAKVFRNGERSATHHPEFSMLEWYRVGATLSDLMDETEALCRAAAQATTGAEQFRWDGRQI
ncbi:MAG: amino acid--tRNA ligase-related protein, partial [Rhodospirillaceae bacterium]